MKIGGTASAKGELSLLYRLLRDVASSSAVTTEDFDPKPVATATFDHEGIIDLHGSLGEVLNQALKDSSQDHGFLLSMRGQPEPAEVELLATAGPTPGEGEHLASLTITITRYPNASLYTYPLRPTTGIYTKVVDGHLSYNGQRLRLWGVCRHFWGGPVALDRIAKMGFNAIRMWGPRNAYDVASASRGEMIDGEGNLNSEDSFAAFDKNFADAKQRGLFIWMAGLHYDPLGIMHKSAANGLTGAMEDDSFLVKKFGQVRTGGQGKDWDDWKKAMDSAWKKGRGAHMVSNLMYFDPRLMEIYRRQVINLLNHVNPYTGKRYAEEEAIAVWELNNEEGFVTTTLLYGNADWPEYFKNELQQQWCQWLTKKYGNDAGLTEAWGELKQDESLQGDHVKFAPFMKDRNNYPAARHRTSCISARDVANTFNQEMRTLARAQAPAGIGAAVAPFIFDTQALPGKRSGYIPIRLAMAVSFGNYQFTYHSSLTIPPGMLIMDNQSLLGKPNLIYETEGMRLDPFRAEYPLRVAAIAGWQDWDGVFWHYWRGMGSQPDEAYQAAPLDQPAHTYADGGIYPDEDPSFCAALSIAGQTFLHGAIEPAKNPAIHSIPPKTVYSYNDFNGENMRRDTFTRGAFAAFPSSDNANSPAPTTAPTSADSQDSIHCGEQITYDWPNGRLIIDTPTMKAYVGQVHGAYRFSDGIAVNNFSSPFVVFAMLSADGKPLAGPDAAKRIYVTAQFNAKNTGFRMTPPPYRAGESVGWDQGWNETFSLTILDRGHAPVVADNIAFDLHFPTQLSGHLDEYDFALREKAKQEIRGNLIHRDTPGIYMSVLQIDSRGETAPTPPTSAVAASDPQAPGAANPTEPPRSAIRIALHAFAIHWLGRKLRCGAGIPPRPDRP